MIAPPAADVTGPPQAAAASLHLRRTPGTQLCGRMRGHGFVEPQWLIVVGGRFLQLPTPLYRIVEAANGRATLAEMAQRVGKLTGASVRPEAIAGVVERILIPLGALAWQQRAGDPQATPRDDAVAGSLALRLKRRVVRPDQIAPFTRVLQGLYWPPILLAVLVAAALALRWLLIVHGIGRSIATTLAAPNHLLIVFALTIAGGAFHELGHAAALRYGGARDRGMGVGLYLVYPAFYTDVSENYRLGRWARVRTDLGGFYFNLVYCLGILGLYRITGAEYLLLIVTLTLLDLVRQCLPFVRLDGYWALADITGIPDFFSTLVPFLRTVVPGARWRGKRLPPLRRWARAVYLLYLLITLPVLALMLALVVRTLPTILLTALRSGVQLVLLLVHAWQIAAVPLALQTLLQLAMLVLPTLGLLLMLWRLVKGVVGTLWRLSRPTLQRRIAGAIVGGALVLVLTALWEPPLRTALTNQPHPAAAAPTPTRAQDPAALAPPPALARVQVASATAFGPTQAPARVPSTWLRPAPSSETAPAGGWEPVARTNGGDGPALELRADGTYCVYTAGRASQCGTYRAQVVPPSPGASAGDARTVMVLPLPAGSATQTSMPPRPDP